MMIPSPTLKNPSVAGIGIWIKSVATVTSAVITAIDASPRVDITRA
jgi:hypothetical protein